MLKEISIKNFRSINNEIFFSMEADVERVSEHVNHIEPVCNNQLLKVASMYGPNGGGKSNLLFAIELVKDVVFMNNQSSIAPSRKILCEFSNSNIIEETIFFVTPNFEIGYSFGVCPKSVNQEVLDFTGKKLQSYLHYYEIKFESIAYRKKDEIDFIDLLNRDEYGKITSVLLSNIGINLNQNLANNNSVVSYLFSTYLNRKNINQEELIVLSELASQINSINLLEVDGSINLNVAVDMVNKYKDKLISLLNSVDIKIHNIIVNKNDKFNPFLFERKVLINNKLETRLLPLYDESKGTIKTFWMLLNLLIAKYESSGYIFICDDMNAYLHPKLYRAIIELLNSAENRTNQLIFNSHDILNMDKDLFRRDEIWFVYRDDSYQTKIVPLSNIVNYKGEQIRKDARYYKQYLEGKYGADPFIKKGLDWND